MPTYDYLCKNCEHKFEEFQSITSSPLKKCPKCGKNKLQRLIGMGAGLIFKGSGFYSTDYRSDSYNSSVKSESSSSSKSTTPASSDTPKSTTESSANSSTTPKTESTPAPGPAPAPKKSEDKKKSA